MAHHIPPLDARLDRAFHRLLPASVRLALEENSSPALCLDSELKIRYVNPAWFTVGESVGLTWMGRLIEACMEPHLATEFSGHFRQVLETGNVWNKNYACAAPEAYRMFRLTVYPLPGRRGLALQHTLRVEVAHAPEIVESPGAILTDEHGQYTQCCQCLRFRDPGQSESWKWVPAWAHKPPVPTSHTLCTLCLEHYYPAEDEEEELLPA